jgi:hypothetical protein
VRIGKGMILGIPTAKTNVKTPNTGTMIVDDDDFLVVRPQLDIVYQLSTLAKAEVNPHTFRPNMIWVAHARNIGMESLECFLGSTGHWT